MRSSLCGCSGTERVDCLGKIALRGWTVWVNGIAWVDRAGQPRLSGVNQLETYIGQQARVCQIEFGCYSISLKELLFQLSVLICRVNCWSQGVL